MQTMECYSTSKKKEILTQATTLEGALSVSPEDSISLAVPPEQTGTVSAEWSGAELQY